MTEIFLREDITIESFQNFLMVKLAPVLIGIKPALLLGMCNCQKGFKRKDLFLQWETYKNDIAKSFNISFSELKSSPKGKQVFFYSKKSLLAVLQDKENRDFLKKFGYGDNLTLSGYLNQLKKRFNEKSFPHEVGVFLGYPISDVKGFVEKRGDCFVLRDRWQIYGCPKKSLNIIDSHRRSEKVFLSMILEDKNPLKHLKKIRDFVTGEEQFLILQKEGYKK